MGILYITEYAGVMQAQLGNVGQVPMEPPLAQQAITYTTHVESAAFNAQTSIVRIETDAICSFVFGTAPVATTSMARMVAGQTEYHGVPMGQSFKVSAVANT